MGTKLIQLLSLILVLGTISVPAEARLVESQEGGHAWCGTDGRHTRLAEAEAKHRFFQQRAADLARGGKGRAPELSALGSAARVRKEGAVAVIEDVNAALVSERSLFDFDNRGITFLKKKKLMRAKAFGGGINPDFGDRVERSDWGRFCTLAPEDDDSLEIDLPFKIRFNAKKYGRIYLNSDGNLTFDTPDCESNPRTLARVLNGQPRIAVLFSDLDVTRVSGEQGLFVKVSNNNLRVTWNGVPEFGTGQSNSNTAQVTIFKNGKINIAFGEVAAPGVSSSPTQTASVGVSPGDGTAVQLVDLSSGLPVSPTSVAILERYSQKPEVDDFGVVKAFFDHFKDAYDHVIVWLDFGATLGGAFAYEITLKNEIQGIGLGQFDRSNLAGSDGRLESFVQMGSLRNYPSDPDQDVGLLGTNSTMDVLGQEAGHRWLAFPLINEGGSVSDEVLGRDLSHWSFFFDSDASDMEGNDIMDLGGDNFETVDATSGFSALDQYFMGLIPPEEVGPMFFVRNGTDFQPGSPPSIGETFRGQRVDITIQNFIDFEGERVPAAKKAPKTFKMAFVLLAKQGSPASDCCSPREAIRTPSGSGRSSSPSSRS